MKDKTQATKRSYLTNTDHVERAYRQGFLIGSRCAYQMKPKDAMDLRIDSFSPFTNKVGYDPGRRNPKDTYAAFQRGFSYGIRYVLDYLHDGGNRQTLKGWMDIVFRWAYENPLARKESAFMPPIIGNWHWNDLALHWINSHAKKGV